MPPSLGDHSPRPIDEKLWTPTAARIPRVRPVRDLRRRAHRNLLPSAPSQPASGFGRSCRNWTSTTSRQGDSAAFGDHLTVDPRAAGAGRPTPSAAEPFTLEGGERSLIEAVLQKDRKAAAAFVAVHIDAVYAYVRHRLAPRADLADDVVQDVFVAALDGLRSFQAQSSLRTWLIGIARHKIEDFYRGRLRAAQVFDDRETDAAEANSDEPPIDESIDRDRARTRARAILARMPEHYGLLLIWRYWEQRSTRDIAAAVGSTEKSVERMLARARAKFRRLWIED